MIVLKETKRLTIGQESYRGGAAAETANRDKIRGQAATKDCVWLDVIAVKWQKGGFFGCYRQKQPSRKPFFKAKKAVQNIIP